eukprot:5928777-Pleurochrysis_carterae.AAC.3
MSCDWLVTRHPGIAQKVDRFVYSQMCYALAAATPESDFHIRFRVILKAQRSEEAPGIVRSTDQVILKCPESVPARAATSRFLRVQHSSKQLHLPQSLRCWRHISGTSLRLYVEETWRLVAGQRGTRQRLIRRISVILRV